MKKQIQRRFIRFSMLVLCTVLGAIEIGAYFDNIEHFYSRKAMVGFAILLALMYVISVILSRFAIKPIERAWQRQLDFTADASHELRTPLAVFKSNLEILEADREATIGSQQKWINNLKVETDRMQRLVEELLILSRADTGQYQLDMRDVPLDIVIRERAEAFEAKAQKCGVRIEVEADSQLEMKGDIDSLTKLFSILIDNSLKYMDKSGTIRIKAQRLGKQISIEYNDDGAGIPAEDVDRIFERFYRVDKARSRSQGGSGLGLAIAKTIVEQHGGTISLKSDVGKGVTFSIRLKTN